MMNKKNRAVGGAPIVESRKKSLGIYVHIPFCRSKCEYCDFYSIPGARSKELMTRYLDAVIAHIRESAPCAVGYEVDTVYFGGGTPSFFGATGLSRIFAEIDRRFDVSRDAEVTLEANPDSVTLPMLTQLRRAGFNRISIGVQSDIDEQLKALGRPHNYKQAQQAVSMARRAGFNNVSVDLMFGLPNQTREQWMQTLRNVIDLKADHISCYGLKVEPGSEVPLEPAAKRPKELDDFCKQTGAALPEGKLVLFGQNVYLAPEDLPSLKGLHVLRAGLELGEVLKNRFGPAHAWALWLKELPSCVSFPAESEEIRRYLAGDVLAGDARGWTLVQVERISLGWAKGDGRTLKNHYPKALRRCV